MSQTYEDAFIRIISFLVHNQSLIQVGPVLSLTTMAAFTNHVITTLSLQVPQQHKI